ncbi:hypothetical protein ACWIGM_08730 [Bosea sp. NPDC055332]
MTDIIDKLNRASELAGPTDENWNRRYVAALNSLGLYLSWWPSDTVPEDAIMAPVPHADGWQYQYPSYVTTE